MKDIIDFNVIVNPFTHILKLSCVMDKVEYEREIIFDEFDEWNSFNLNEREFDLHIHYDTKLSVSIYDVIANNIILDKNHNVNLIIKLEE
jgi:hypothetical protein